MSAVSNLTYVTCRDTVPGSPEYGNDSVAFSNYNEAMSFAKWVSVHLSYAGETSVFVWNYNGISGFWYQGSWSEIPNSNWP